MAVSDYYLLDYIQSNGNQFASTGLNPRANNAGTIEVKALYTSTTDGVQQAIFGSELAGSPWGSFVFRTPMDSAANKVYCFFGSEYVPDYPHWAITINSAFTMRAVYRASDMYTYGTFNGGQAASYRGGSAYTYNNFPIYLFCENDGGTANKKSKSRIYYFKWWNSSNSLICNMVPARRVSDGVAGMYCLTRNSFWPNIGTGTFTQGSLQSAGTLTLTSQTGGTVSGGGTKYKAPNGTAYYTATATPNSGYRFVGWYSNADRTNLVSSSASYSGTMTSSTTLYAKFVQQYTVSLSSDLSVFGSTTGAGTYDTGSSVTITATTSKPAGIFLGWFNGSSLISTSKSYTFTLTGDVAYKARFVSIKQIGIKIAMKSSYRE